MERYLFMFKENQTDNRDCVKYIEKDVFNFECGHYFGRLNLNGACFSEGFDATNIDFENITTILEKLDFEKLDRYSKEIQALGCGIEKGSERYKEGMEIQQKAKIIIDKLKSDENINLFKKVIGEEKEFLIYNEGLRSEEVEELFNNYNLDYRDRAIFSGVSENYTELGEEEVCNFIDLDDNIKQYFNYSEFGEDLAGDEGYIEFETGRIARVNY